MSDTSTLLEMINSAAIYQLEDHYRSKKVVLDEAQNGLSAVEVVNVPEDTVVINVDDNFSNERLFSGTLGESKRCDFIMISESAEVALFIELKASAPHAADHIKQFKGGLCVLRYCQAVACEFLGHRNFLSCYGTRYVAFVGLASRKRPTGLEGGGKPHSTPEKHLTVRPGTKPVDFRKIAK